MNSRTSVDQAFSDWLVKRSLKDTKSDRDRADFGIAIEAPCSVCQPRVAIALAQYLNEFDDSDNHSNWLPVTDHCLEQLQAHDEFREMINEGTFEDSTITYLSQQGGVVLQLPKCHAQTADNPHVFQVSMSCHEPTGGNHHLWINAKRIPGETLVPMIANAFFDWACNGGDLAIQKDHSKTNS
jgi:hypothetical protein